MCKFFSAISNGKGRTLFFKVEQIAEIMANGNKENYAFNSHTSIARFNGINGKEEDKWNKWEYDTKEKILKVDSLVTFSDREDVQQKIEEYLKDKDLIYLQNMYNGNSGNRNSGHWNSGDRNSGNGNSGDWNSGSGVLNGFCTKQNYLLFDKKCTKEEYEKINKIEWTWFWITQWVSEEKMTDEEKKDEPLFYVRGGYLKTQTYKEAWKACPKEVIDEIKKLKNFNTKKFEEITGIKV